MLMTFVTRCVVRMIFTQFTEIARIACNIYYRIRWIVISFGYINLFSWRCIVMVCGTTADLIGALCMPVYKNKSQALCLTQN